ncbi:hypothetical protein Tco_1083401 [Tanacetum coccineum]
MRIDDLHKFSDGTLNDIRTALDDRLKGIRMKYLPQTIWRQIKEFQRSFRHSDTKRLSRSDEVLKLKNFKKDATLKLFKSTNQERYEHVGPEVTRSHGGKIYKMAKRDYAWLMISRCSRSHSRQAKEQAQDLKSMITTSNHKIND